MLENSIDKYEPWFLKFLDLMPFRVREVLLVSSPYDAFILEEDGRLTERLFTEYSELNLSWAPRITHASTGSHAMKLMHQRHFDLVLTMGRLADMNLGTFGRKIKSFDPLIPVVLLAFTEAAIEVYAGGTGRDAVDLTFLWTGDNRILLAIIKLIEDLKNVRSDTENGDVRVIIVVEDSVRRYSSFLSLLYNELMKQSHSLIAEGLNDLHKLSRMRARPKILLTRTFEEALSVFRKYKDYTFAVISDARFPMNDVLNPEAGFELLKIIKKEAPGIPILLQSAEPQNRKKAEELGIRYADKNSDNLLRQIRTFLRENLGFGPFIFRLPNGEIVGKAEDMYEMERVLSTVPAESIEYHGSRNDFSLWLMARSLFNLAKLLKPRKISEFETIEEVRAHLLGVLRRARIQDQEGIIADLSARKTGLESQFVRLGSGSLGGKGRGLAFANSVLVRHGLLDKFPGLEIRIPRSVVIGTDHFDRFFDENPQLSNIFEITDDREIVKRFISAQLSDELVRDLERVDRYLHGPLAVRSSSLLEDSHFLPFAGIYSTYMLPNNHPSREVRFWELCRAIMAIYASTFRQNARTYMKGTPYRVEEEKMAVVIQEMVGSKYGNFFYPPISGVGLSYNYYPVGYQKAEEGIVMLALGLGQIIVMGGTALQFSPGTPNILPQFTSAEDYMKYSQNGFYALDLTKHKIDFLDDETNLGFFDLKVAEKDGALAIAGSVYSPDEDRIRDNLMLPGPRVVTFNNVLKWNAIPLAEALAELLRIFHVGMGCVVEIEFAVDMGDWGKSVPRGKKRRTPCLYVLQTRPQVEQVFQVPVDINNLPAERILFKTNRSLGHGIINDIRDIVYVKKIDLDSFTTPIVAGEVEKINSQLTEQNAPYLLIGPGRWGTSDARLGIPVKWAQIAGARIIVETSFSDRSVEPSQGTHFFHNIRSFGVGYLTVFTRSGAEEMKKCFDWLNAIPAANETEHIRHVRLNSPVTVHLDGKEGSAAVLKPEN